MFVASCCTSNNSLKDQVLNWTYKSPMTPMVATERLGYCQNHIIEAGRKGKEIILGPIFPSFSALPSQHWWNPTRSQKHENVGNRVHRGRLGGTEQGKARWRMDRAGKQPHPRSLPPLISDHSPHLPPASLGLLSCPGTYQAPSYLGLWHRVFFLSGILFLSLPH